MPTSKYLLGWIMVLFYFFYKLMFKLLSCCISGRKQTSVASRRRANMPASTQTALSCAALKSSVDRANSSKLTSGWTFIFREWIYDINVKNISKSSVREKMSANKIWRYQTCRIRALASSVGCGNSIFRSNRPERIRAGSRMSARFVAAITCNLQVKMAFQSPNF